MTATAGVSATISAAIVGAITKANDIAGVRADLNEAFSMQLQPGTGVGKADGVFSYTRTIAASSSENLDLAAALSDVFGSTLTAVKVKAILVRADDGNTNNVEVGGAGSNTFTGFFKDATDIIALPPGGWFVITHPGAGWTVTAATGDILKIANSSSGTGVTYDIIIVYATA